MRKLFLSLSLAAASSLFAGPAFAQDKPQPPADPPAQQDKDKAKDLDKDLPKKSDLDKDRSKQDLPKDRLPDAKQPMPRDDAKDLQKDLNKDAKDQPAVPDKKPQIDPNRDVPNPNRSNDIPVNPARPGADQPAPAGQDRNQPPQPAQPRDNQQPGAGASGGARANVQTQRVSGKIVSADNGQVVIRTDAGKEITLNSAAQTHFLVDGRPARFADFRVGSTINAAYVMDRDRLVLDTLAIGDLPAAPAPAAPAAGTLVQGTVVRVIGNDQIVIKTADNREVIVQVSPQTRYQLSAQGGAFADVQPMMPVQVWYDVIDRRPLVRTIRPWRR